MNDQRDFIETQEQVKGQCMENYWEETSRVRGILTKLDQ